ncbi:uncharacterized protein BDV14DRAFT_201479 [Aspergillus stella-maris]|uniref:uncharacterized protein n=1 Tax=Aspergillus stella-maris TaxID=1810926 RepID=UPI003CCD7D6B
MTYAAATPSGTWLFERSTYCRDYVFDRDPDLLPYEEPMNAAPQDEYPDDYRSEPSPILSDLHITAAQAAQHMPQLKKMELTGQPHFAMSVPDFKYYARQPTHIFCYDRFQGRVLWEGHTIFDLSHETKKIWDVTWRVYRHSPSTLIIVVRSAIPRLKATGC